MKICRLLLFPLLFLILNAPIARAQSANSSANGLRVKIECEDPAGIFLDKETVDLRRSILFSIQFFNQSAAAQKATLTWRIQDASGKTVLAGDEKYPIPSGGFVSRRELFIPSGRGEFLLTADGYAKQDGPDLKAHSEFAFSVIAAPSDKNARPFLLLDAPLQIADSQLEIYSKIGVRALRTVLNPAVGVDNPDAQNSSATDFWRRVDAALTTRAARGLATVGVLRAPVGSGPRRARDDEEWLQFALLAITRSPSIRTWEIVGDAAPETISELARAAHNMNPSRSLLAEASPMLPGTEMRRLQPADGIVLPLSPALTGVHPAAFRRALLVADKRVVNAGSMSFHVREIGVGDLGKNSSALDDAVVLTTQTVAALAAGAQGVSAAFDGAGPDKRSTPPASRAAVFAALQKMLGDADFHSELFPTSPILSGVLFGTGKGSIAVLWTAPGQDGKPEKARVETWLKDANAFDVFGNSLAQKSGKNANLNLSSQPIYIQSNLPPDALARALRDAKISGFEPLAAQVLPFTQPIEYSGDGKPKDGKFAPAIKMALRVRLQNIGIEALAGTLKVNPPPSWKLENDSQPWSLKPGESRIYDFAVSQVKLNDEYPVTVEANATFQSGGKTSRGRWNWAQKALIATAANVSPDDNLKIDGELNDWNRANWMQMQSGRKNKVSLALKWDSKRLYVAARVQESRLTARREGNDDYNFWKDGDAIQLAFSARDANWMEPGNRPFRDTDCGLLLSPFFTRTDGTIDARVLRLWNAQIPFGALPDRTRWGGAVPGARIEIRRDERSGETIYEAAIPLSEIPDFNPATRVASEKQLDSPIRFSWILHSDNSAPLQWSEENHVFDWWNNTTSFLPGENFSLAAQTILGFSQNGEIADVTLSTPAPGTAPVKPSVAPPGDIEPPDEDLEPYFPTVSTPAPTPKPTPKPTPRPTPPKSGNLPRPVPVEPIPPDMLPPAPPRN